MYEALADSVKKVTVYQSLLCGCPVVPFSDASASPVRGIRPTGQPTKGILLHYYKRNLGDYAKKAGRLSMLQHGSYTLLIDACYDREQFPTKEEAIEWTWASSTAEIEAVEFVLRKFFTLEGGVYVQKRIQEEIAEYRTKAETNKRIATERETKRKANSTDRAPIVNEAPPNHKPITINQEPRTINQEPPTKNQEKSKPTSKPCALASRLPADWKPGPDQLEFCKTNRPDLNPLEVAAGFVDYWIAQPGAKGRKVDWSATWRNWVRNQRIGSNGKYLTAQQQRDENNRRSTEEFLNDSRTVFGGSTIEGEYSNA